jgi:Fe-S cluster biosynthesis and repair protein YggX
MIPPGALLSLSDLSAYPDAVEHEDGEKVYPPWCWATWQARTELMCAPFSPTVCDDTPELWRPEGCNSAVWAFISNYFAKSDGSERIEYIKRRADNDGSGRNLYLQWFKSKWSKWSINQAVVDVLAEHGMDPYSVMKRHKLSKVRYRFFFTEACI